MNPLNAFMVTGYAITGAGLCALAAISPEATTTATLVLIVAVAFWRAHYWYRYA